LTNPHVYFEATGVYSRPFVSFCEINSITYTMLNPLELHYRTSTIRRLKNDRTDANRIAQFGVDFPQSETKSFPDPYCNIRELSRFINQIGSDIKLKRMKLHVAVQQSFSELEKLFANSVSKLALNIIQLFPHPELVSKYDKSDLIQLLMSQTDKCISRKKSEKYARQLMTYAAQSYPSVSCNSIQTEEVRYYAEELKKLIIKKEQLVKQIIQLSEGLPEFHILTSMPGIGPQSAAEIIGELGDIRRFSNSKKLNAYVGIDLNQYQSGTYTAPDHINKRGNSHARAILYFTVRNMIRQQASAPNHIVDYYYRLKKGPHPKRDKVATVACMNKLLKCLIAMVKANQEYAYAYHGLEAQ
ncbi:IS110 family transposase, partial [Pediococcus argentinicus]